MNSDPLTPFVAMQILGSSYMCSHRCCNIATVGSLIINKEHITLPVPALYYHLTLDFLFLDPGFAILNCAYKTLPALFFLFLYIFGLLFYPLFELIK
jgi:hypothetical protein